MQVHDTIFFIVLMVNVALIEALEVDGARYYSARELTTKSNFAVRSKNWASGLRLG